MEVMKTIMVQHDGKHKWEKAQKHLSSQLQKEWNSKGNITLTEHIASFRSIVTRIVKACKYTDHTVHTVPTEREQVLLMLGSISATDSQLQAHISSINGDPDGRGMSFT